MELLPVPLRCELLAAGAFPLLHEHYPKRVSTHCQALIQTIFGSLPKYLSGNAAKPRCSGAGLGEDERSGVP